MCASGLWRDGDPPGHGLQVLLPVDGNGDSLSINRQIWKLQRRPPHSDSIHLQTYRGQPSNGYLVATADVSVRLKDNFLFVNGAALSSLMEQLRHMRSTITLSGGHRDGLV